MGRFDVKPLERAGASVLVRDQVKTFGPREFSQNGVRHRITAEVRFDDRCGNGHNTFSITGHIEFCLKGEGRWREDSGGCLHDEIAKHFPELAGLIKWHLCSTDGPMHYIANTVYMAGDRDHWGLRKGEFEQLRDKETGMPIWELDVSYAFVHQHPIGDKPAPVTLNYKPWGREGEGKARELDAARSVAIWPEATDAELCAPDLREKLEARLPGLLVEFRRAVEGLGFTW